MAKIGEVWDFNPIIKTGFVSVNMQQPTQGGFPLYSHLWRKAAVCPRQPGRLVPSLDRGRAGNLPGSAVFLCRCWTALETHALSCLGPSRTARAPSELQTRRRPPLIGIFFISWEHTISPSTACQRSVFGWRVSLGDLYLHWPAENSKFP